MGIYSRCAAAFLIALLASPSYAVVRTKVGATATDTIKNKVTYSSSADFQTPNGALQYYGAEKYYAIDPALNAQAGDSVGPTVRPIKGTASTGQVSFPYGEAAAMPGTNNPVAKIKPGAVVPKSRVITSFKNALKATPAQMAVGIATSAALAGVGWLMEDGVLVKKTVEAEGIKYYEYPVPDTITCALAQDLPTGIYRSPSYWHVVLPNNTGFPPQYEYYNNCNPKYIARRKAVAGYDPRIEQKSPVTESDFATLDPWLNQQNAAFFDGLIRESCEGSLSPDACYESLRSSSPASGPTSLTGASTTRTTTTKNPDGSTSTKQDVTNTTYNFTYGDNYFDISTNRTTTTYTDGQQTSTTTETDTTPPQDNQPEVEEEEQYTFSDTEMPEVPSFYEQKYPDGLAGVWDSARADVDSSAFIEFLKGFIPSFSGTCPAFSLNMNIYANANYGVQQFGSICWVLDFVKVVILITAMFTFRKVTFGG